MRDLVARNANERVVGKHALPDRHRPIVTSERAALEECRPPGLARCLLWTGVTFARRGGKMQGSVAGGNGGD